MSAVAPNEITEAVLKDRILKAYNAIAADPDTRPVGEVVDELYEKGDFKDFVGVVGKAVKATRLYASQVCIRHGKGQIAAQIREGR